MYQAYLVLPKYAYNNLITFKNLCVSVLWLILNVQVHNMYHYVQFEFKHLTWVQRSVKSGPLITCNNTAKIIFTYIKIKSY